MWIYKQLLYDLLRSCCTLWFVRRNRIVENVCVSIWFICWNQNWDQMLNMLTISKSSFRREMFFFFIVFSIAMVVWLGFFITNLSLIYWYLKGLMSLLQKWLNHKWYIGSTKAIIVLWKCFLLFNFWFFFFVSCHGIDARKLCLQLCHQTQIKLTKKKLVLLPAGIAKIRVQS